MHAPDNFTKIINRKKYSTSTAALIASNAYWDGHNFERSGRNTFLYRTPRGNYFYVTLTAWQGERDQLIPVSQGEAIEMYETNLSQHEVEYSDAFPDVIVEEA